SPAYRDFTLDLETHRLRQSDDFFAQEIPARSRSLASGHFSRPHDYAGARWTGEWVLGDGSWAGRRVGSPLRHRPPRRLSRLEGPWISWLSSQWNVQSAAF